ncbi:unnamed protein product [Kuraishia capsulata CBS 1993]|uniref:Uncharacterized protein n=1 Tax=Kuraishia capsulata CBS 1993 TaxID=1382522 RepID=W6MX43_9ASCO|nr:uncharacterized protein KUCA_T00004222001 [Kuraishia capsulata CBS 1993]CDK28240.1 unnamed protein product [Kuraishia capsulata CBS 1993]
MTEEQNSRKRRIPLSEVVNRNNQDSLFSRALSKKPLTEQGEKSCPRSLFGLESTENSSTIRRDGSIRRQVKTAPISELLKEGSIGQPLNPTPHSVDLSQIHKQLLTTNQGSGNNSFSLFHDAYNQEELVSMAEKHPRLVPPDLGNGSLVSQLAENVAKINTWYNATNFTHFPAKGAERHHTQTFTIRKLEVASPYACVAELGDGRSVLLVSFKDQFKSASELVIGDTITLGNGKFTLAEGLDMELYYQWQRI